MTGRPAAGDANGPAGEATGQRIDKWLWAARFFKTRSAAAAAVSGGKVEVAEQRVKPSRRLRVGDAVRILRGAVEFRVEVLGLCDQRRPASEAQRLYEETAESLALRTAAQAQRAREGQLRSLRLGRPDKHARRELARLKGR